MSKITLDRLTIEEFYKKYKEYLISIGIIIVCFVLLITITIPQIGVLSVRQQETAAEKTKLRTLNNNLNILLAQNDKVLDSELSLGVSALPSGKDFASIINSINLAANKSGVFLGDYAFVVGDLSKVSSGNKSPILQISLILNVGAEGTIKFVNELYKSLPIAEVSDIQVTKNSSTIDVAFFYKPFAATKDNTLPIMALTPSYKDLLKQLATWNNPGDFGVIPVATKSASSSASPF